MRRICKSMLMGIFISVNFILMASVWLSCQQNSSELKCRTYLEPMDPSPDTTADWEILEPGLHAVRGSINERYLKSSIPKLAKKKCGKDRHGTLIFLSVLIS